MNFSRALTPNRFDSDIVIIGAGGAGLAAAIEAAETGARVTVLEKRRNPGGSSAMAVGLFAAESHIQKRMFIDAGKTVLFKRAMDYSHWKIDPWIVRPFIEKSADTISWMEGLGIRFDTLRPLYPNQSPLTWHCIEGCGAAMIKTFVKKCEDLGVRLLCRAAAKKVLTDKRGKVVGVTATVDKKSLKIRTKAVIIATGGYGGSRRLLKRYFPSYHENMRLLGMPHTGDGIQMAIEAGAATEGLGMLQLHGAYFPSSALLNAAAKEPNTIWLNKNGMRFTDETTTFSFPESGNAVDRQPEKISYTLFDEEIKRNMMERGLIRGILHVPELMPQTRLVNLEAELKKEAGKGRVKVSRSWNGIADWVGIAPEVLKNTVRRYNDCCDRGFDDIFSKDLRYLNALRTPPFYGIRCYSSFLGTVGGIKISPAMEVLDTRGKPILGLYAAGVDTGGWEGDTYNPALAGSTLGFTIHSGRIAGENAAKHASG